MNIIINIFIFFFGASLGSFLNVVVGRLHSGEPIIHGHSHCMRCKKTLAWYELLPIVSFIIQKGKCRTCGKKISWQYILVEITTGFAVVLAWAVLLDQENQNWTWYGSGFMWLYFIGVLIVVFLYDLKYFLIPDIVIYPTIAVTLLWDTALLFDKQPFWNYLMSAIIPASFFLSLIIVSRGRWMGMGDVKLAFLLGLFLGFPKILLALFLAFTLGSFVGLGLIIFKKYTLKTPIPFGTFLTFASFITLLYGDFIIQWYLEVIGFKYILQ